MRTAQGAAVTQARQQAERRGRRSEAMSALYLRLSGWRILDQRVRTGVGEIDLVARRGGILAFIEVKQRRSLREARYAVTPRQQARLIRAASLWRSRHPDCLDLQPRFDVFIWPGRGWPRHIQGAFGIEGSDLNGLV